VIRDLRFAIYDLRAVKKEFDHDGTDYADKETEWDKWDVRVMIAGKSINGVCSMDYFEFAKGRRVH
jgi:hypothetical protein